MNHLRWVMRKGCMSSISSYKGMVANPHKILPTITHEIKMISTTNFRLSENISRYPVPEKETLDSDIKEIMNGVEEKTKFVPNVMKVLAHRPEEFRAFFNYYDILMTKDTGSLTKAEKELIVVATSASNNCIYCVVAHGAIHRIYSKDPYKADQVSINSDAATLSPREQAIVRFALDVAHMEEITEDDFTELEQHGLDREDAWNIGAITALFALSNRMAHLTAMKPNEEFYLMGRVKKG